MVVSNEGKHSVAVISGRGGLRGRSKTEKAYGVLPKEPWERLH